jgi:DNA-binding NtrC family response regulator
MRARILVVDDEPSIRKVLEAHLTRDGYAVDAAADGTAAVGLLAERPYDLVISDLKMPHMGGLELLAHVRQQLPGLPLIVVTAHGTVDVAVEALKLGAHDFITKPFDLEEMNAAVAKAIAVEKARRRSVQDDPSWQDPAGRFDLIGRTPAMERVYALIERVAASPTTVLIEGESGTGKELVARALHGQSSRREQPFVAVNCGAIPENLFESELFGHEKGAFTGAASAKPGRFELAHTGTLFLDEVGELPRDMQVKLLRVLQERVIERVGGTRPVAVDVRVLAATNVDLEAAAATGTFRTDLLYRLNVIRIRLPPLRERLQDIPLLAEHFVRRFNQRLGMAVAPPGPAELEALAGYTWPGNIRELENVIERGVLLSEGSRLALDVLPGPTPAQPDPVAPASPGVGLKDFVRVHTAKLEKALIVRTLEQQGGNVTRAARRLEISRKSLQLKMKEYQLRGGEDEGSA